MLTERLSDELHELQPIFEKALWIFGPDYDTIQYTSNKPLITVLFSFLFLLLCPSPVVPLIEKVGVVKLIYRNKDTKEIFTLYLFVKIKF